MGIIKFNLKSLLLFLTLATLSGITSPAQGGPTAAASAAAATGWVTIHNDFFWYDQTGTTILTRAGCLRKFGDLFYWYGLLHWQDKNGWNDQTCYTSADLIHWTYKGIVFHSTVGANRMDVLYNEATKKYVMFLKYGGNAANLGIAIASAPDAQFTFLNQVRVDSADIGDMSMYQDDDGKAYLAYVWDQTGPNRQHGIYLMSADYLTLDKQMYLWNIASREAPHIFKRNGLYYYGTSETNGVKPSPTRYYTASNLAGPWSAATTLITPGSSTTYETQCDFVFPFTGTQGTCYMFEADRWLPIGPKQGGYLWLPLEFNGTVPTLNYYQDWDLNVSTGAWRTFDYSRNLASGKAASASSVSGANVAAYAFDSKTYLNYTDTRWESAASDPQWLMVDLGAAMAVNRVILKCDSNYAKAFQIQVSTNSSTWTDVYSTTIGGAYSVTDVSFTKTTARYVRMYGTQRGTSNGYSLFDFMVLNDSAVTSIPVVKTNSSVSGALSLKFRNGTLHYSIPFSAMVKIDVFDSRGRDVANLVKGFRNSGGHDVALSGQFTGGIYVYRLIAGNESTVSPRVSP